MQWIFGIATKTISENSMTKIILDTNIIISYLISNGNTALYEILKKAKNKEIHLFCSISIWEELLEALKYPKISSSLPNSYGIFLTRYKFLCEFLEPTKSVEICRDARDNKFLELVLESHSDYLITGDYDLLELKEFKNTKIVKLIEYLKVAA
jgi:uncharacterized protein